MSGSEGEQDEAMLRRRAAELRGIARDARLMPDTAKERDLERLRAEIEEAIAAIEGGELPFWAIADRLRATASMLDHLLFMNGINALTGRPVRELRADLAAWLDGA